MGSTRAKHRRRLEATLQWVVDRYMQPLEDGGTTVTTAGIDDAGTAVAVSLNRRDEDFARQLVAESNGLVRVADDPTIIDPL